MENLHILQEEKHHFSHETVQSLTRVFHNSGNKHFNPPTGTKVKASTFSIPGFPLIRPEAEY